jgi:hypothetical protein
MEKIKGIKANEGVDWESKIYLPKLFCTACT